MGRGLECPRIDTELHGDLAWYGHWAWRLLRKKCHKADLQRALTKVRWGQAGGVNKCLCPDLWPSRLGPSKSKSSFPAWQINCVLKNSSLQWGQWLANFLFVRLFTSYTEVYIYPSSTFFWLKLVHRIGRIMVITRPFPYGKEWRQICGGNDKSCV